MSGSVVALDTNLAIAVLNDSAGAGEWVTGFAAVYLPIPVVGELRYGAINSQRAQQNLQRIETLVRRCQVLEIDLETTDVYARVRIRLKRAGTTIPENDVWIAALCTQHELPFATSDEHFAHVEGLRILRRSQH